MFFDKIRLLRSLRPLRLLKLLRFLRPLREITQYVKRKVLFSAKMHKKAKNIENKLKIAIHLVHSNCFYGKMIFHFHVSSYRGRGTQHENKNS